MNKATGSNEGPHSWANEEQGRLVAMIEVAQAAGRHTLAYFGRADLAVDAKADASPVTVADRQVLLLTAGWSTPSMGQSRLSVESRSIQHFSR